MLTAEAELSQPQTDNTTLSGQQIMTAALGQQFNQAGVAMAQKNMNLQPTLTIRPGYQFNMMVTKDNILTPWRGWLPAAAQPGDEPGRTKRAPVYTWLSDGQDV